MSKRFYTVSQGQTLLDIALEVYGDIEGIFPLIEDNPELSSVDDDLFPGQKLLIDGDKAINEDIAGYYEQGAIRLNSRGVGGEAPEEDLTGLISFDGFLLKDVNGQILKAKDQ